MSRPQHSIVRCIRHAHSESECVAVVRRHIWHNFESRTPQGTISGSNVAPWNVIVPPKVSATVSRLKIIILEA